MIPFYDITSDINDVLKEVSFNVMLHVKDHRLFVRIEATELRDDLPPSVYRDVPLHDYVVSLLRDLDKGHTIRTYEDDDPKHATSRKPHTGTEGKDKGVTDAPQPVVAQAAANG